MAPDVVITTTSDAVNDDNVGFANMADCHFSPAFLHGWEGIAISLEWRHNEHDSVSNHRRFDLFNRAFLRRSKKTSKLLVTGLCEGNSPVTGEFPTQRASDAENASIWLCHYVFFLSETKLIMYWFWYFLQYLNCVLFLNCKFICWTAN